MLKKRVITACILIPIVLALIFFSSFMVFMLALSIFFLLAAWEWTLLSGFKTNIGRGLACVAIPVVALGIFAGLQSIGLTGAFQTDLLREVVVYTVLGFWVLASIAVSAYPRGSSCYHSKYLNLLVGAFVLIPPWTCLLALHQIKPMFVLYPMVLVWAADIAAYFAGRRFGRHKLAVNVSPGKTWEGVAGALAASVLVSIIGFYALYAVRSISLFSWVLLGIIVVLFSIVGDLFESVYKREQHLKDSGSILPGHGGILDRIDSLTAAVPIFVIGLSFF